MKVKILFFLIYLIQIIQAQDASIHVIEENRDNYYFSSFSHGNDLFLCSTVLDHVDMDQAFKHHRIDYKYDGAILTYPLYPSELSGNNLWIAWAAILSDRAVVTTTTYDIHNKSFTGIDTISIFGEFTDIIPTKAEEYDGNVYQCISMHNQSIRAEKISLISFDRSNGTIGSNTISIDTSGLASDLFLHRYITDMEIINNDSVFLTGFSTYLSLVDLNFNVKKRFTIRYPDPVNPWNVDLFDSQIAVHDNSTIFGCLTWPFGDLNERSELFYKLSIRDDSVWVDTVGKVSNPEMLNKTNIKIIKLARDQYLTCTNPDFQVATLKAPFPCSFYLTKFEGFQEQWHKAYGGDHYYRVRDIHYIEDCRVLVVGSVYDYYSNGFVQGFYAIIDCDGNLVTSNIELRESSVNVYPNPSSGRFVIDLAEQHGSEVPVAIYSIDGQLLTTTTTTTGEVDVSQLNNGTYIIVVDIGEYSRSARVVIQR